MSRRRHHNHHTKSTMIDKDIVIKKLEDLSREVARIEFSHDYHQLTIEAAIFSRRSVEDLIRRLRNEPHEA